MAEFCMPSLGADMRTGTLVAWKVKVGDPVKHGDIIADVETDKGIMEIEIFEDGVVDQLLIEPHTKVPVGTPMAQIRADGAAPTTATPARATVSMTPSGIPVPPSPTLSSPPPPELRQKVSPLARRRAAELGVDLQSIQGTGPEGAIQQADVEAAAQSRIPEASPTPAPLPVPPPPPAGSPAQPGDFQQSMRRAIAAAMTRANRDIPHYYLETRIDMSPALRWLEVENQKRSIKDRILPVVMLIKAVAKALTEVPELNGYWLEDQHQIQEGIHIGFAISLRQGGLVTPAIHHADLKSLDELMVSMRDLISRTRSGRLRSSELTDATITLTSLGDIGVEKVYGVIYPPQVALVGFGKIAEQPWAENGLLGVRPVVTATLAGDHRATDGMIGAKFLQILSQQLHMPEAL
ncbi:MAG: pyruvate dehydrogenase complex dihydrolipoamide acetyltransferase [Synechococcales cyanobacterium]